MLPNVLFIGPTKSGTTWIHTYLRAREDIVLPAGCKETFFFDKLYARGLPWYESNFVPSPQAKACIEVAPSLFSKPETPQRVAKDLPGVRAIVTMRAPVSRAVSHYFHYLKAGEPDLGFPAMVERHPALIECGLYYKHVRRWQKALGNENVAFVSYDQLRDDRAAFCTQLCETVGVPDMPPRGELALMRANVAAAPRFPAAAYVARRGADALRRRGAHRIVNVLRSPALRRLAYGGRPREEHQAAIERDAWSMYGHFRDDIEKFEAMLGRKLPGWHPEPHHAGTGPSQEKGEAARAGRAKDRYV
ncbi:hypothetical protein CLD20_08445 [Afifella sp. IM 167]|nr:sulfotransferase domain-containing protein [Afifella sp. IM 167]MBZ8133290.1 hypothetical protein [Afifella sp. IM 167]